MLSLDIKQNKPFAEEFKNEHLKSLIEARDRVINSGIEITIKKNKKTVNKKIYVSTANRKFLQKKLTDNRLKKAMLLTPKQQRKVINLLKKKFPSLHNQKTKIYQFLKYIFITSGYEKLDSESKKLFYTDLKINSCIYCNRNYIFDIKENGHIKGHIDHFYPKAKYPYFAMNFYNFIPVCESCNRVKNEFDTTDITKVIIHPYERKNEKVFGIEILSVDEFSYKLKKDDLLQQLHIEKIYNTGHKDILEELYIKFFQKDTKEYFDTLKKEFKSLGFNDKDVYRYLTCRYLDDKEFHKRAFSKMTYDMLNAEFKAVKELKLL